MKSLSRKEMKNVRGGGGPVIPGCAYGAECSFWNGSQIQISSCGNVWNPANSTWVCGCLNEGDALLCPPGGGL